MQDKLSLSEAIGRLDQTWTPRVLAALNGQLVKLARTEGAFVWHSHEHEDELFFVVEGHLDIHLDDRVVGLDPGELFVVPRGVRHKPVGSSVILLFEPAGTRSTGQVTEARTVEARDLRRA